MRNVCFDSSLTTLYSGTFMVQKLLIIKLLDITCISICGKGPPAPLGARAKGYRGSTISISLIFRDLLPWATSHQIYFLFSLNPRSTLRRYHPISSVQTAGHPIPIVSQRGENRFFSLHHTPPSPYEYEPRPRSALAGHRDLYLCTFVPYFYLFLQDESYVKIDCLFYRRRACPCLAALMDSTLLSRAAGDLMISTMISANVGG